MSCDRLISIRFEFFCVSMFVAFKLQSSRDFHALALKLFPFLS